MEYDTIQVEGENGEKEVSRVVLDYSFIEHPIDKDDKEPVILLKHEKYEGVVFRINSMGYHDQAQNEDGSYPFAVDYDIIAVAETLDVSEFTSQYDKEEFEEIVVNIAVDIMAKINASREHNTPTTGN